MRTYLAVAGGIDVPVVLGSRSTDLKAGFGGHQGRALKRGDKLPSATPAPPLPRSMVRPSACVPALERPGPA
jgi:allophanate hydrolase subunit 2